MPVLEAMACGAAGDRHRRRADRRVLPRRRLLADPVGARGRTRATGRQAGSTAGRPWMLEPDPADLRELLLDGGRRRRRPRRSAAAPGVRPPRRYSWDAVADALPRADRRARRAGRRGTPRRDRAARARAMPASACWRRRPGGATTASASCWPRGPAASRPATARASTCSPTRARRRGEEACTDRVLAAAAGAGVTSIARPTSSSSPTRSPAATRPACTPRRRVRALHAACSGHERLARRGRPPGASGGRRRAARLVGKGRRLAA